MGKNTLINVIIRRTFESLRWIRQEKMTLEEKDLSTAFQECVEKIGNYLEKPAIKSKIKVLFQDKNSEIDIPDLGRNFGTIYEDGNIILANWLNKLSNNESKYLIEYFLLREAFRLYFDEIITDHPYERFTEIILYIITILLLCEDNNYTTIDRAVYVVRSRGIGFEEDELILKPEYWTWFLKNCYKCNIKASQLFQVFVQRIKEATKEKKPISDLAWDFVFWLRTFMPEEISHALPIYIQKKRFYDLIKILGETPFNECSALALSKEIGRSHRVISRDFKLLLDEYDINWYVERNILKYRLFPYFFRINLKKDEHKEQLIKKLTANRYIRYLKEGYSEETTFLVGWIESPQIAYRQLEKYLEKLLKSTLIEDYFIGQIRRKKITWAITTKKLEPTEKTYQTLLKNPEKLQCYTIKALDKTYDITKFQKTKKEYYNEDVLLFLSTVILHRLGRAYYIFRPVELKFELCEKKGINTSNTAEVMDFVNQMDLRCRRLGLIEYYLNFKEFIHFKKALYFEINEKPEDVISVLEKLEAFGEMMRLSFLDRIIIYFHDVIYDSVFRKFVEKLLKRNNISYRVYQINHHRGLNTTKINYTEAYDFDSKQWKID
ncbi:MAG: hypothetical protein FK733_11785 [Asgard group archaeon]|nr:hypothetical protein [Asgard group archaeon]